MDNRHLISFLGMAFGVAWAFIAASCDEATWTQSMTLFFAAYASFITVTK